MIIIGVIVAVWLGERRWTARGGTAGTVVDIAVWAVPFGLVGGRIYHVITDWQLYFDEGRSPVDALKIWNGGLGIWGAISLGALGAWIGCRRRGISLRAFADALAPGIAFAQAIGRWGNWFNQELYGRPTTLPWAVEIDPARRPVDTPDIATYHPTFLYESLWCLALGFVVIWAGKRFSLSHGRTFALYVAGYTIGRFWIEALRVDTAHEILGMRLNNWTSIVVFLGAVAYLWVNRNKGDVEEIIQTPVDEGAAESTGGDAAEPDKSEAAAESTGGDAAAATKAGDSKAGDSKAGDSKAEDSKAGETRVEQTKAEAAPAGETGETGETVVVSAEQTAAGESDDQSDADQPPDAAAAGTAAADRNGQVAADQAAEREKETKEAP